MRPADATIRSRTAFAGSEASRQSRTSTISSQRPGAWKPQMSRPVGSVPNEYSSLLRYRHCSSGRDDRLGFVTVEVPDPPQGVLDLRLLDV